MNTHNGSARATVRVKAMVRVFTQSNGACLHAPLFPLHHQSKLH